MSANYAAGEFKIEAFTLVNQYNESLDLTNMVMGFKLFESIFNKFVTGEVSVYDGLNLPKNFRMTGQEYIRIAFSQKEGVGEEIEQVNEHGIEQNMSTTPFAIRLFLFRLVVPTAMILNKSRRH